MNTSRIEDFIDRSIALAPEFILRPNTGRFWQDALFVLAVTAIQIAIAPSLTGRYFHIDALTPWLVITCVRQRPLQATMLVALAAFALETRSAAPRGLYLCSYWIMANIIITIRPTFSWRHHVPWYVTYVAATVFIIAFESFVYGFTARIDELGMVYWLRQLVRLGISAGFGMILAREWLSIDAEEPVPS
jgi:hypothetical protein